MLLGSTPQEILKNMQLTTLLQDNLAVILMFTIIVAIMIFDAIMDVRSPH